MKQLLKNKHWEINKEYDIDKILYLLIDRPTYINFYNDFIWRNNKDKLHREYDLPAIVNEFGYVAWYINDKFHRGNNKPAIIWFNGKKECWIND